MESLKGGVSFKVNFIDSGDNPGNSSGESQRLIGRVMSVVTAI